jgi:hypothetical protein
LAERADQYSGEVARFESRPDDQLNKETEMDTSKMFELAASMKLRFPFRGQCTAEDLFDLTREQLSDMYTALTADKGVDKGESLILRRASVESAAQDLRIEIVKHVFGVKDAERVARLDVAANKSRKEKILSIMAGKQDASLEAMPVTELQKLLDELK